MVLCGVLRVAMRVGFFACHCRPLACTLGVSRATRCAPSSVGMPLGTGHCEGSGWTEPVEAQAIATPTFHAQRSPLDLRSLLKVPEVRDCDANPKTPARLNCSSSSPSSPRPKPQRERNWVPGAWKWVHHCIVAQSRKTSDKTTNGLTSQLILYSLCGWCVLSHSARQSADRRRCASRLKTSSRLVQPGKCGRCELWDTKQYHGIR